MQPTFTYGDERDKIQKDKARQAKKQLARDEAWAVHEKKRQERQKKREQAKKEKDAKRAAALKAKAAKAKASGSSSRPTTVKPQPVTRSKTMPTLQTRPSAKAPHRTQSMNTKKVVYTVAPQAGVGRSATTGHRSRPPMVTTQSSRAPAPAPRRATAPVQPWGPIRTATHTSPVATTKPRVTRAQTFPTRRP